jgi:hypothetical protein
MSDEEFKALGDLINKEIAELCKTLGRPPFESELVKFGETLLNK